MKKLLVFMIPLLLLTSCDQVVETPEVQPARAVKTMVISEASKANSRQISGVVKTADESELSFRVGGRVSSVKVNTGASVTKRQVLATLEKKEFQLALKEAQANLASARADMAEKKDAFRRQKNLKKKNFVSQAAVDKARTTFKTAISDAVVALTHLKTAQNDLEYTTLRAPFSGKIAKRLIDPFVQISAGKAVFQLQSEGSYKIEVLMPETLVRDVSYGDVVSVRFPTLKDVIIGGTITEIGARAESGNAFPVRIKLARTPSDIRSGMTAQVTFNFGETENVSVYLIPVSALDVRISEKIIDNPSGQAKVFVFNSEKHIAEARLITIRDIRGNKLEVVEGLKTGDTLIVAGVPFLTEGQKVKQWEPTYNTPATINLQK